jgi:hypothetical protein
MQGGKWNCLETIPADCKNGFLEIKIDEPMAGQILLISRTGETDLIAGNIQKIITGDFMIDK